MTFFCDFCFIAKRCLGGPQPCWEQCWPGMRTTLTWWKEVSKPQGCDLLGALGKIWARPHPTPTPPHSPAWPSGTPHSAMTWAHSTRQCRGVFVCFLVSRENPAVMRVIQGVTPCVNLKWPKGHNYINLIMRQYTFYLFEFYLYW